MNIGVQPCMTMLPGTFQDWTRIVPNPVPFMNAPPPILPRTVYPVPYHLPPQVPMVPARLGRQRAISYALDTAPIMFSQPRSKSLTPDIIIERRRRRCHHHRSPSRSRVIQIPLDNHSTLSVNGSPKRILEIERVRCHRHRKCHSPCYDIEYDNRSTSTTTQAQPNVVTTNPISDPCKLTEQRSFIISPNNSAETLALISNMTPEMIQNLPKQTVYLPPIRMSDSQPDATKELKTIILPTEIVNPIDRSLSVIQPNPTMNTTRTANIQPIVPVPSQTQLTNLPQTNVPPSLLLPSSLPSSPKTSGPFMQRVLNLFERCVLPKPQVVSPISNNPSIMQPLLPLIYNYNANTNSRNILQPMPQVKPVDPNIYPPANIQPINTSNIESYNTTGFTLSNQLNMMPYPPANITPCEPTNNLPSIPSSHGPYSPANITPITSDTSPSIDSANPTSYYPNNINVFNSETSTHQSSTYPNPYQSSVSTSPNMTNSRALYPNNTILSNSSYIGPYSPANITPYSARQNLSDISSTFQPSTSSMANPPVSSSTVTSPDSFVYDKLGFDNARQNVTCGTRTRTTSTSTSPEIRIESNKIMPKSILRNATSNHLTNTTYTRLNSINTSSYNGIVRKTATLV